MLEVKPTSCNAAEDAVRRVDAWMRLKYGIGLDQMDITSTPGYWQDKEPKMHLGHPLHVCALCFGPFKATYTYFDPRRENGRFVSRTRSWAAIRAASLTP